METFVNDQINGSLDSDFLNFRRDIVDCGKEPKVILGIGKNKKRAWEDCIRQNVADAKFNEEEAKKELEALKKEQESTRDSGSADTGGSSGGSSSGGGGNTPKKGMNKILKYSLFGVGGVGVIIGVIFLIKKLRS